MEYGVYFLVAIILLFLLVKVLEWPFKIFLKLVINGIMGAVLLVVFNLFGSHFGFTVGINVWTALISGFFGVPGVIFLIIFKILL